MLSPISPFPLDEEIINRARGTRVLVGAWFSRKMEIDPVFGLSVLFVNPLGPFNVDP